MGIKSFVKGNRPKRYAELLKKRVPKEELRDTEQKLLTPRRLPKYCGAQPVNKTALEKQTVKIVFHTDEDMAKFKRHFPVSKYIEPSLSNNTLLLLLLDALDSGEIIHDKKKAELCFKRGDRVRTSCRTRGSKVGERE